MGIIRELEKLIGKTKRKPKATKKKKKSRRLPPRKKDGEFKKRR